MVNSFCFGCCSLKTGALIILLCGLLSAPPDIPFEKDIDVYYGSMKFFQILFPIIGLFGIYKNIRILLLPFIILLGVKILEKIVYMIGFVYPDLPLFKEFVAKERQRLKGLGHESRNDLLLEIIYAILVVGFLYFFIVMLSYFRQMKKIDHQDEAIPVPARR